MPSWQFAIVLIASSPTPRIPWSRQVACPCRPSPNLTHPNTGLGVLSTQNGEELRYCIRFSATCHLAEHSDPG